MLKPTLIKLGTAWLVGWLLTAAIPAQTNDFRIAVKASFLYIAEDSQLEADPAAILTPLGFGANFHLGSGLELEISLDLFAGYFLYSENLERALSAAIENRSTLVIGCLIGLTPGYHFQLTPTGRFRLFAGPAADLRLCLVADRLNPSQQAAAEADSRLVADYFKANHRWLLATAGLGIDFDYTEHLAFGTELRFGYPLYRLWTAESRPFWDEARVALSLRLGIF